MPDTTDRALITQYVRHRDHEAFAQLVHRYITLVRSAALRHTRDAALADDVTQAAMIVLARRAREIPPKVVLASWLYTVTHHLAQNSLKARSRRIAHEAIAAAHRDEAQTSDDRELREVLDAAIARLPEIERGGVVLHFFNNCTHEQIAGAMGMSSEAVRKRVSRALVRMRNFLTRRGFELSVPALSNAMRAESSHASTSAASVHSIVSVALLSAAESAGTTASASAILANGILGATKTTLKWKIAASLALASAGFAGIASFPLTQPIAQAIAPATVPATQTANANGFVAQVAENVRFEALASAPHPATPDQWFGIDGKPIDMPHESLIDNEVNTDSQPDRQIVFKIDIPVAMQYTIHVPQARTWSTTGVHLQGDESLYRCRFAFDDPPPETLTVLFNIATHDWRTIADIEELKEETEIDAGDLGALRFSPPAESQRWGVHVSVRHANLQVLPQMFAIDRDGKAHLHKSINNDRDGAGGAQAMFIFDIPADQIRGVRLQVRDFDKQIEFSDIALHADQPTLPKVVIRDLKK